MEIAALGVKIMFQKNETVVDGIGNHRNVWTDYYGCCATVSGEGGTESTEAGTTTDHAQTAFTVRFCRAASRVDTTGYRILFQGEPYNILAIDHLCFKRKALKFKCRKER